MTENASTNAPDAFRAEHGICENCEERFTRRRRWARFCSVVCRRKFHVDQGARAVVIGVTKTGGGVIVTLDLDITAPPLKIGDYVRLVRKA